MSDPKKTYLSASRIDCYHECSQRYAARYLYKLPDPGNDGSNRGSTCHDILEHLLKPRHRKIYEAALNHGTCKEVPALWRALLRRARHYGVADETNLDLIDGFMMVALRNEFLGPNGTVETFGEREFVIEVNEPDGRRYNIRGKIDQTFIVRTEDGLVLDCRDFKSSKAAFSGDKEAFNVQSIIYRLALKILHPDIKDRRFRFLFLRKPRKPWQEMEQMTDTQLEGYEYVLTDLQQRIEGFTLANAAENLAANNEEYQWLCGREGVKKDGTVAFLCPARRPREYWVALKDGKIERSGDSETAVAADPAKGEKAEKRAYPGCPAYYDEKGRERS